MEIIQLKLGINGIIQNVFQGDYTTKQKFEQLMEINQLFSTGGGHRSMENSMKIIFIFCLLVYTP